MDGVNDVYDVPVEQGQVDRPQPAGQRGGLGLVEAEDADADPVGAAVAELLVVHRVQPDHEILLELVDKSVAGGGRCVLGMRVPAGVEEDERVLERPSGDQWGDAAGREFGVRCRPVAAVVDGLVDQPGQWRDHPALPFQTHPDRRAALPHGSFEQAPHQVPHHRPEQHPVRLLGPAAATELLPALGEGRPKHGRPLTRSDQFGRLLLHRRVPEQVLLLVLPPQVAETGDRVVEGRRLLPVHLIERGECVQEMLILLIDVRRKLVLVADQHPAAGPHRTDQELAVGHPARLVYDERVEVDGPDHVAAASDDALGRRTDQVGRPHERVTNILGQLAVGAICDELAPPRLEPAQLRQHLPATCHPPHDGVQVRTGGVPAELPQLGGRPIPLGGTAAQLDPAGGELVRGGPCRPG